MNCRLIIKRRSKNKTILRLSYFLAEPKADAADVAAAFFELLDLWSEAFEAASFELGLELWSAGGHNDCFAGADQITGEAFGALGWVDENLVDIRNRLEFSARSFVESLWAISNRMLVDNAEREVEIVEEAVGMIGFWINKLAAVRISLWFGMELNKFEAESFGGELLRFRIRAIAGAGKQVFVAN